MVDHGMMSVALGKRFCAAASIAVFLSGCAALPRSGPDDQAIDRGAALKVVSKDRKAGIDYALVDITSSILPYFSSTIVTSLSGFGGGRGGPANISLGYGDILQVSIFESQAGGLFIPSDAGSRPGNYITLPQQTIDRNGSITIPYAGRIQVAGRLKEEVEQEIEDRLASRAIEPQVVITVVTSRSTQVAVLGDVNEPQRVDITAAGARILDVISSAGGLTSPNIETSVTLQRRGRIATVAYNTLLRNPSENIYVAPGDVVSVEHERRTFLAFGAAGLTGRFDFEDSNLSLGEAIGKAGGLRDDRADPAQVLLYRLVSKRQLTEMGIDVSHFVGDTVPVVFRANMRDPSTMFAVQKFKMADKDIIYISNSDSVELLKFLDISNSITSSAAGIKSDIKSLDD
jgi:polysaccharide export outer membrane protein